jgi:serine/threonine protein kinase
MTGPQDSSFSDPMCGEEAADLEDLLIGMLRYGPEERITLDQISAHPWFSKKYASDVEGDWLQTGLPDLGEAPTYVWRYGTAFRIS